MSSWADRMEALKERAEARGWSMTWFTASQREPECGATIRAGRIVIRASSYDGLDRVADDLERFFAEIDG